MASVIRAYENSPVFVALAASTQAIYKRALDLAERPETLGDISTEIIRPALIQAFLDGLSDLPGKQKNTKTALGALEKWALVRDLLPYPIMTGTSTVDSEGGHEPWTDEQVALAEKHARADLARAITLAVNTGQRGSDIVKMHWSDIQMESGRMGINVIQRKTGVRLWVPFPLEFQATVEGWERRATFLLLNPDGKQYKRQHLSWHWNKERDNNPLLKPLKDAGLVLHGLRATAVVRFRKRGLSVLQISDIVGMSEPMVARYSRLADKIERALAAVHYLDGTIGERRAQTKKDSGL